MGIHGKHRCLLIFVHSLGSLYLSPGILLTNFESPFFPRFLSYSQIIGHSSWIIINFYIWLFLLSGKINHVYSPKFCSLQEFPFGGGILAVRNLKVHDPLSILGLLEERIKIQPIIEFKVKVDLLLKQNGIWLPHRKSNPSLVQFNSFIELI